MIVAYIIIAIFVICGIILLCGKGSWLIAGYNTASEEEKKKYDVKKLCRSMGVMCLLLSIIFGTICFINTDKFALVMIIPILLTVGFEFFYVNKYCYKK
jgi:hypothetical protein